MSLRINTNMSALNALRNVERASDGFGRSIEKLASGLRINRSADDPAGLIRSEDLRAQIVGLEQAISNSQDATNLIKTAEGALDEMHNLLRSMRQLAVASGNTGTNNQASLQANQNQIASAIDSINRISAQTQFGTKKRRRRGVPSLRDWHRNHYHRCHGSRDSRPSDRQPRLHRRHGDYPDLRVGRHQRRELHYPGRHYNPPKLRRPDKLPDQRHGRRRRTCAERR
jgi:hypothetical protein